MGRGMKYFMQPKPPGVIISPSPPFWGREDSIGVERGLPIPAPIGLTMVKIRSY